MALRCGVRWFITVLDVVVLRLLQLGLRRPFARFPGLDPKDYFGSVSVPCVSDVTAWADRLASVDPTLHETIVHRRRPRARRVPPRLGRRRPPSHQGHGQRLPVSGLPPRELLRTVA